MKTVIKVHCNFFIVTELESTRHAPFPLNTHQAQNHHAGATEHKAENCLYVKVHQYQVQPRTGEGAGGVGFGVDQNQRGFIAQHIADDTAKCGTDHAVHGGDEVGHTGIQRDCGAGDGE